MFYKSESLYSLRTYLARLPSFNFWYNQRLTFFYETNDFKYPMHVESYITHRLWQPHFTYQTGCNVHPYWSMGQNFPPFKGWVRVHCMHGLQFAYLFIYSGREHVNFSHFFTTIGTLMNVNLQISLQYSASYLDIDPEMELLHHVVVLF